MVKPFDDDIQHLTDRYEQAPESRLFAPLADAYRKNGDIDRAIQVLEKGLERFSDYASARVILGKCFYDKGATERAREEFGQVLDVDPENMVALKFMGDILLAEESREEAARYYKKLLAIDPTNREVAGILKQLEEDFHVKEIDLGKSDHVKKIEQPRELATITLAGIYAAQGYYNKALRIYRDILEKEPENAEAGQMVEKLEGMVKLSEHERNEAFGSEVMTISLDDIGDDLADSTTGHGGVADGSGTPATEEREGEDERAAKVDDERRDEISSAMKEFDREDEPAPAGGSEPETERQNEDAESEPEKEEEGEGAPAGDLGNFKEWLKKMKSGRDDED